MKGTLSVASSETKNVDNTVIILNSEMHVSRAG